MIRSTHRSCSDSSHSSGTGVTVTRGNIIRELDLSMRKHPSMSRLNRTGLFQHSVWDNDRVLSTVARAPGMSSMRLLLLVRRRRRRLLLLLFSAGQRPAGLHFFLFLILVRARAGSGRCQGPKLGAFPGLMLVLLLVVIMRLSCCCCQSRFCARGCWW